MASETIDSGARRARTLKYGTNMIVGVVLMIVAIIAVNFAVRIRPVRLDLTQGKQYTLSSATENLLKRLKDNVTITVYASSKDVPPDWRRQKEELTSLLSEYRQISKKRVNFVVKDPSDPKVEDEARKANIEPQQMSQIGTQSMSLAVGYLGFVVQYLGKSETVAALRPTSSIEYQLTRAINKVAQLDKPTVAVLSTMPEQDPMAMMRGQMPQSAFSLLPQVFEGEGYEVKTITPQKMSDLTSSVAMLFVMQDQPEDLSEEALYRIDQYVMNGGKLFVASSGVQLSGGQRGGVRGMPKAPNINSILDNYGLHVNSDIIEDWERGTDSGPVFTGTRFIQYMDPFKIRVTDLSKTSDITKPLPGIFQIYPSSIGRSAVGTSGTITVLAKSSARSRKQDGMFVLDPLRLAGKTPKVGDPGIQSFDLISMVQGPITSRFASVEPPALTDDNGTTHPVAKANVVTTAKPGAAVIVSGSGISFSDNVLASGATINAVFLQNAADSLTRAGAMTGLRAKQQNFASLREVSDREETWAKILAIGAVPLLVVAFGILKLALNARRKARYRAMYARRGGANQPEPEAA